MIPLINSSHIALSNTSVNTEPMQLTYATKEKLYQEILKQIENYETEFSSMSFSDLLKKKLKKSSHKSIGVLLEKLTRDTQQLFQNNMQKKLSDDLPKLWTIYQNGLMSGALEAKDHAPILILGPKKLRESMDLVKNFGILSDENNEKGCILGGKWSSLRNDLMILSAIHTQKVVMFFFPEGLTTNSLWNSSKNCPSTLCREISILHAAGYEHLSHPYENLLGYVLTSKNPEKANAFTLHDVITCCNTIKAEVVKSLFNKN